MILPISFSSCAASCAHFENKSAISAGWTSSFDFVDEETSSKLGIDAFFSDNSVVEQQYVFAVHLVRSAAKPPWPQGSRQLVWTVDRARSEAFIRVSRTSEVFSMILETSCGNAIQFFS